jgi:hypothetical protein
LHPGGNRPLPDAHNHHPESRREPGEHQQLHLIKIFPWPNDSSQKMKLTSSLFSEDFADQFSEKVW